MYASAVNTFALSDGATISYDSALWAQIVCRRYVEEPQLTRAWLDACIAEFNGHHDRESMPWNKEAAFDRGSFASLIGVRVAGDALNVDAVGDSLAVLFDGVIRVDSFPYRVSEQFDQAPMLLSTDPAKNPFFDGDNLASEHACHWRLEALEAPRLLCVTDALGQWLLSSDNNTTEQFLALDSDDAFSAFVTREREAGRLKRDDTTLLALW
jgi:hypothetical protein